MKKIYKNPEMEIIKINAQQLLSGSTLGIDSGATPVAPSSADGRGDEYDW